MAMTLGILGSPRRGGNTELLLDSALNGASSAGSEVVKVILNDLDIRPCQECGGCDRGGVCVIDDDMTALYSLLDRANIIVLATPIFFDDVSAQTKLMIDRSQAIWTRKYRLGVRAERKRPGAMIAVSARMNTNFDHASSVVRTFFLTLDIELLSTLTFGGFEEKGSITIIRRPFKRLES